MSRGSIHSNSIMLAAALGLVVLTGCSDDTDTGTTTDSAPAADSSFTDLSQTGDGSVDAAPSMDAPPSTDSAPVIDAPQADAPQADAPQADAPGADAPGADAPKADTGPTGDSTVDSAPAGDGTVDGGASMYCGGPSGFTCQAGESCDIRYCASDATGTCISTPPFCLDGPSPDPVCGCNGMTYNSDCLRIKAGAALHHVGECVTPGPDAGPDSTLGTVCGAFPGGNCAIGETCNILNCAPGATGICQGIPAACPLTYDPVCGCNGVTYGNDCLRTQAGAALDHAGECVTPDGGVAPDSSIGKTCGPFLGGDCAVDETCNILSCAPGATGTCVFTPQLCTDEFDPVCGCDGMTYENDCVRIKKGAVLDHVGECVTPDAGVAADGAISKICGPFIGGTCAKTETCNILSCLFGANGTCVPTPVMCAPIMSPVCGCDSVTYDNDCSRIKAGVALDHTGGC